MTTISEMPGASPSIAPAPVATALPPRNRRNTGNVCPTTAAAPASASAPTPPSCAAISTAAVPFSTSSMITGTPTAGPSTRTALVPPVLPLPSLRRSTPRSRPAQYPKGQEPSR